MRRLTYVLSVAAAVAVTASAASAQWSVLDRSRVETRNGEVSSKIPPGHLPAPGECRVWVDGTPPGRQPRPTDCATAERERYRYGSNARVIYGNNVSRPGKSGRRYDTTVDGRTCAARDVLFNGLLTRETDCDRDGRWDNPRRRGDDDDDRTWRRTTTTRRVDVDDSKARERALKEELKAQQRETKQLQKANKGQGHGNGHGKGHGKKG
jgi:hypothetical protein